MTLLHLLLIVPLAAAALVLVYPQVLWRIQAWQYRDPEAVQPSGLWFLTQRVSAVAVIALCLAAAVVTWEPGRSETGPEGREAVAEIDPQDQPYDTEYTVTHRPNVSGAIISYTEEEPQTLVTQVILGRCHRADDPVTVRAEETEDTVTLHAGYLSAKDTCLLEDVSTVLVDVELAEPLGNREVQDRDGEPID